MKLKHKLGLVGVVAAVTALVLALSTGAPVGNAAVGEYTCYCSQPQLSLTQEDVYWTDYTDYTHGILSIDYDISNGTTLNYANAHNLQIVGTSNSNGVLSVDHGRNVNMVSTGECELLTVKYQVPSGVSHFTSHVYATTHDQCGNSYAYPGPMP